MRAVEADFLPLLPFLPSFSVFFRPEREASMALLLGSSSSSSKSYSSSSSSIVEWVWVGRSDYVVVSIDTMVAMKTRSLEKKHSQPS